MECFILAILFISTFAIIAAQRDCLKAKKDLNDSIQNISPGNTKFLETWLNRKK